MEIWVIAWNLPENGAFLKEIPALFMPRGKNIGPMKWNLDLKNRIKKRLK